MNCLNIQKRGLNIKNTSLKFETIQLLSKYGWISNIQSNPFKVRRFDQKSQSNLH